MDLRQMKGIMLGKYGRLPNPQNAELALQGAEESIVLLKNNGLLPLQDRTLALFGAGAVDTVICGTGSGYVFPAYTVNVYEGLKKAGAKITSEDWIQRFCKASAEANKKDKTLNFLDRKWSGKKILVDDLTITDEEIDTASAADTAVYVIRRSAGEEADRKAVKGDYDLTDTEYGNIQKLARSFGHLVIILNTCVMNAAFLDEIPGIDAALYISLPGMEGGRALANILFGIRSPSGKLTDTWARRYEDYPASATFSANDGNTLQEDYTEDIYTGYRWFDSFQIEPQFPFGFGLSYTEFSMECISASADWQTVSIQEKITNCGKHAGKQVVQLYASAPAGKLDKPFQELKAYVKTKDLKPGESETVTLSFPTEELASFDAENSRFLMEKGRYILRLGEHSRKTDICAAIDLDNDAVTSVVTDILHPDHLLETRKPSLYDEEDIPADVVSLQLHAKDCITAMRISQIEKTSVTYVSETMDYQPYDTDTSFQMPYPCTETVRTVRECPDATFFDMCDGKVTPEEFTASLEPEILVRLVTGTLEETPYKAHPRLKKALKPLKAAQTSGQTTAQFVSTHGIPNIYLADGPAGMHIIGCAAASFPVGTAMAQTWNEELIRACGYGYGKDMKSYHVTVGLGPGMNIHRDPLCGRNFEYYSEDPLISGRTAAAFTKGVQDHKGCFVSIKHFAANNQENDRLSSNSTVSQRALREIYLKGFEICVKEASPATLMTSYNLLNGMHTSSNRELVTDLLRGEWGFDGLVMSDWGTLSDKGFDLHAGNDLIMGGYSAQKIIDMMHHIQPSFEADGSVREIVRSSHFGMVKTATTSWGSFQNETNGKDTVSTIVAADTQVGEKVLEAVKSGLAEMRVQEDGSHLITYFGTDRGAYLCLGDLQACAIRVLKLLQKSETIKEISRRIHA